MRSLATAARHRVLEGETSVDEVRPILGMLAREAGPNQGGPPGAGAVGSVGCGTGATARQLEA